jgi:hypothetical protein
MIGLPIERGAQFGRWMVLRRAEPSRSQQKRWLCRCECGIERVVLGLNLRKGRSKSCGCLQRELALGAPPKHGMSRDPEYFAWQHMRYRCLSPSHSSFFDYGERGIRVDPEWAASFEAFYRDVGPRPSDDHCLALIDRDSDYGPGNVHWITRAELARNRRPPKSRPRTGLWFWRGKWRT